MNVFHITLFSNTLSNIFIYIRYIQFIYLKIHRNTFLLEWESSPQSEYQYLWHKCVRSISKIYNVYNVFITDL